MTRFNFLIACVIAFVFFLMTAFNLADVNASYLNCLEIEEVKEFIRLEAEDDYANLDQTLELLGLERTPQIEERALSDLERTVSKFEADNCKRFYLP